MSHRLLVAILSTSLLLSAGNAVAQRPSAEAPAGPPFPMPVDVRVDGRTRRVEMPGGHATLSAPASARIELDPYQWVLRADQ
jgi:hypothetical protein